MTNPPAAKALKEAAVGQSAHVAFDQVGAAPDPASLAALQSLQRGGRLVLMGSMTAPVRQALEILARCALECTTGGHWRVDLKVDRNILTPPGTLTAVKSMATRPGTKSVLLVVDVQVGVVASAWQRDQVVSSVALAVLRAREARVPVVWVQHDDEELKRGTPAWQWVPELQPLPAEARIYKHFNSAFEDTGLLALLDELHVSRVFLAGAATNWCIRATAYGALDRGFDVTLLGDAHTTGDIEAGADRVVEARTVIDDLNIVMRWLSYPGRINSVATAAGADFGSPPVSA